MKKILNMLKYKLSKLFLYLVISLIGLIRKCSDDAAKTKIDNIVCNSIKNIDISMR